MFILQARICLRLGLSGLRTSCTSRSGYAYDVIYIELSKLTLSCISVQHGPLCEHDFLVLFLAFFFRCVDGAAYSWSVAENWPAGGEIDTFEGINDVKNNRMTLHTEPVSNLGIQYYFHRTDNYFRAVQLKMQR